MLMLQWSEDVSSRDARSFKWQFAWLLSGRCFAPSKYPVPRFPNCAKPWLSGGTCTARTVRYRFPYIYNPSSLSALSFPNRCHYSRKEVILRGAGKSSGPSVIIQPSHTISTYGPDMAQTFQYHSHNFVLVRAHTILNFSMMWNVPGFATVNWNKRFWCFWARKQHRD